MAAARNASGVAALASVKGHTRPLHHHNTTTPNTTMPPHKARARPNPQPQPSDYETDAPPPPVHVPLPPPRSNEELNFSVLRRIYPDLSSILHVAPYAALYTFNLENQQWEKVGIEGTLFICHLAPSPVAADRFSVAILNRRGLDNFYLELTSEEETEITDPYVILQGDQVYGIWIFAEPPPASTADCRTETAAKIVECAQQARLSRENAAEPASAPMGRQLSLRDLFGQTNVQQNMSMQMPTQMPTHMNMPMQDPHMNPQNMQMPMHNMYSNQPYPSPQQDVLGQLFMRAKQDYNGVG
jgi:hypothetical protein